MTAARRPTECAPCEGTGHVDASDPLTGVVPVLVTCGECNGTGLDTETCELCLETVDTAEAVKCDGMVFCVNCAAFEMRSMNREIARLMSLINHTVDACHAIADGCGHA